MYLKKKPKTSFRPGPKVTSRRKTAAPREERLEVNFGMKRLDLKAM